MNSCEQRKCHFWNGKICTDEAVYVSAADGEDCCRYHPDAMLEEDYNDLQDSDNSFEEGRQ